MTDTVPSGATTDLLNGGAAPQSPAPAPAWRPAGYPTAPVEFSHNEAVAARARIDELKGDKEFYAKLKAEGERGVSGEARQEWDRLHKIGWPSPTTINSQVDVDAQTQSRAAIQWNSYIGSLRQRFELSTEQEAELRSGVVDERVYSWAQQEKARVIKDRGFYRRLLDGDRAANRDWGLLTGILSLRPRPPTAGG